MAWLILREMSLGRCTGGGYIVYAFANIGELVLVAMVADLIDLSWVVE